MTGSGSPSDVAHRRRRNPGDSPLHLVKRLEEVTYVLPISALVPTRNAAQQEQSTGPPAPMETVGRGTRKQRLAFVVVYAGADADRPLWPGRRNGPRWPYLRHRRLQQRFLQYGRSVQRQYLD